MATCESTAAVAFREIPELTGIDAGSDGHVYSRWARLPGNKVPGWGLGTERRRLSEHATADGYRRITINRDGRRQKFPVHRLILMAFVGPRPAGMQGCHNNGKRDDNRPENLRWARPRDNEADKARHGTKLQGETSPSSRLSAAQVQEARRRWDDGETLTSIGRRLGVDHTTIHAIVSGKNWAHLPRETADG